MILLPVDEPRIHRPEKIAEITSERLMRSVRDQQPDDVEGLAMRLFDLDSNGVDSARIVLTCVMQLGLPRSIEQMVGSTAAAASTPEVRQEATITSQVSTSTFLSY